MQPLLVLLIGMAVVILSITVLRLHAFVSLILAAMVTAILTVPEAVGSTVAAGFGDTARGVGIVIAMAAVIGKCLMESGAAERIVLAIRRLFGDQRLSSAFATSSFVLGIPVFFDTVFYLLMPIGRATARKTGKHYLLYTLSIVAGATMAHSLVPPTPGPVLVAAELGVPFLQMMLGGLIVGSITVSVGLLYARWADRHWDIPLRPSEMDASDSTPLDESKLPGLGWSLLPVILPILLLAAGTIMKWQLGDASSTPALAQAVLVLGDKNVALTIAAMAGIVLLASRKERKELPALLQSALASGGVIILITCAGGSFGDVIEKHSGLIEWLKGISPEGKLLILPLAFGLTTLVRIAQGSATVSMITSISIVGGLAPELDYNPLYLALAIGCGSKPIPWMNDSGFWIISRMSGMTEGETLKTASVMMSIMGFVGLPVVMLGAWLLPLA